MILEHLLSPLQEQKLRAEAKKLRQDNARLKLRIEQSLKKLQLFEEEKKKLTDQVASKQKTIKKLNEKIEQLELNLHTYAGMIFKSAAKRATSKRVNGDVSKRGGQKGHLGKTRKVDQVDETIQVTLDSCPDCGGKLRGWNGFIPHTVEDIVFPSNRSTVVSTYLKRRYFCCKCQKEIVATHPNEVANSHFGVTTLSLILLLKQKLHLPLPAIVYLLQTLFGLSITNSGVQSQLVIAKKLCLKPYQALLKQVRGSPVKHADETTWKVLGRLFWAWIVCTKESSYLTIEETRGKEVAERLIGSCNLVKDSATDSTKSLTTNTDLIKDPTKNSVLIRDDYAGYQKLGLNQQSCWAHLLRKARDYAKLADASKEIKILKEELGMMFGELNLLINSELTKKDRGEQYQLYLGKIDEIIRRDYQSEDVRRIQTRIRNQRGNLLTALLYEGVPLTNNQAERDLRGLVIQRKISGSSQSVQGAEVTAVLTSIVSTLNKRQIDLLTGITQILKGADIATLGL